MKRGEVAHHGLVLVLFVGVHGLSMLAEVVEARKLFGTVAGERALAGVFPASAKKVSGRGNKQIKLVGESRNDRRKGCEKEKKIAHVWYGAA